MLQKFYNLLNEGQETQERLDARKREYELDHDLNNFNI